MSAMFSDAWMKDLQKLWNDEVHVYGPLQKAGFSANIAYGFKDEEQPRGVIVIENGKVTHAGDYGGEQLDWDLRAAPASWQQWQQNGFGLARLGIAVTRKILEFRVGNYRQMIRNPSLSAPFLEHFNLMMQIRTDF